MRVFILLGLVVSMAAPEPALAQSDWPGPFLWKVNEQVQRKIGDELIHRGEVNWISKYKELALNQPRTYDRTRKIAWNYTREVQSVRRGKVSKDRLELNKWTWVEQDGLPDNSLEGYGFEFRGVDSGRSRRTFRKGKEALSANAQAWAEHHLRNFEESLLTALKPKRDHLRKGEQWTIDPIMLSVALQLDELSRVDAEKSKVKGRLREVRLVKDVFVGRYEVEADLVLGQLAYTQQPWTSGGILKLNITVQGPLEPLPIEPYIIKISGVLRGSGEIQASSGEKIKRELEWTMNGEWSRSLP